MFSDRMFCFIARKFASSADNPRQTSSSAERRCFLYKHDSLTMQKDSCGQHDPEVLPDAVPGRWLQGLIIVPQTNSQTLDLLSPVPRKIQDMILDSRPYNFSPDAQDKIESWIPSPLSHRLGFPVKLLPRDIRGIAEVKYNPQARLLLINSNKNSDNFGKFHHLPMYGDVLVVREDGDPLTVQQLAPILFYINDEIVELARSVPSSPVQVVGQIFRDGLQRKLSAAACHHFCEEWIQRHAIDPLFAGSVNPIHVPRAFLPLSSCACCLEKTSTTGGPLGVCTGCGSVAYCSQGCQERDWDDHQDAWNVVRRIRAADAAVDGDM